MLSLNSDDVRNKEDSTHLNSDNKLCTLPEI